MRLQPPEPETFPSAVKARLTLARSTTPRPPISSAAHSAPTSAGAASAAGARPGIAAAWAQAVAAQASPAARVITLRRSIRPAPARDAAAAIPPEWGGTRALAPRADAGRSRLSIPPPGHQVQTARERLG